jgi:hypothetical protein
MMQQLVGWAQAKALPLVSHSVSCAVPTRGIDASRTMVDTAHESLSFG